MNIRPVQETKYGVYVWWTPNGIVANENGDYLSIPSVQDDMKKINILQRAARACGVEVGHALFFPGHRQVTEEEYQEQKNRMSEGLIPDQYDAAAWMEQIKNGNKS